MLSLYLRGTLFYLVGGVPTSPQMLCVSFSVHLLFRTLPRDRSLRSLLQKISLLSCLLPAGVTPPASDLVSQGVSLAEVPVLPQQGG